MKRVIQLSSLILLFAQFSYSQTTSQQSEQIVKQMLNVYASCLSYEDTGEVKTVFIESTRKRRVVKPFTTAFVRPLDFRYEFKDRMGEDWKVYIVSKRGTVIQSWWTIRPTVMTFEELSLALSGAVGVSGGSAATVPFMLMPDLHMRSRLGNLRNLKLAGEEMLDGKAAYKIEGQDYRERTVTFWIDKSSSLLLKLFETAEFDTFKTESTTTYSPQVNTSVAPEKLVFKPA
jgi:hypothetical protein